MEPTTQGSDEYNLEDPDLKPAVCENVAAGRATCVQKLDTNVGPVIMTEMGLNWAV